MFFTPQQRWCESCEVSSTLDTCWLCDGPTVPGQGPVAWNSSHDCRASRSHTSVGGKIVPIEEAV